MTSNMTCDVTGDHSEINAFTRSKREERSKIFANLPQKTQEMLITKPTFFNGDVDIADEWIQTTREFAQYNQMEFSFALDMLLRGSAKLL